MLAVSDAYSNRIIPPNSNAMYSTVNINHSRLQFKYFVEKVFVVPNSSSPSSSDVVPSPLLRHALARARASTMLDKFACQGLHSVNIHNELHETHQEPIEITKKVPIAQFDAEKAPTHIEKTGMGHGHCYSPTRNPRITPTPKPAAMPLSRLSRIHGTSPM